MKFQVSDGEKFQKVMEATIEVAELEQPIRYACKRLANSVNIPGFRKGKAPRSILESFVGMDAILNEMAEDLLPKAYSEGLKETGLEPVAQPDVEIVTLLDKEPVVFKFIITVKPEIKLGDYKGLEVSRRIIDVVDADVDEELENQRQRMVKQVDAEEGAAAADGDTVTIDFKGMKDGVAFEGGTAESYPLTLGSNTFIPGFEEQVVGMKIGDVKNIEVKFPDAYPQEDLAGQPVVFEVKVNEIKCKVLPELNQEFVEEVSETATNLDELKAEIRKNLEESSMEAADNNAKNAVTMIAVDNCEVELPPVMIEQQINTLVEDSRRQIGSRGLAFEKYLEYMGQSMEEFREDNRPQAEFILKRDLMVDAIVQVENIEVSDEDVDAELEKMSSKNWMSKEQMKEMLLSGNRMEDFKFDIQCQKAIDMIYENAVITDEHTTKEEIAAQQAEQMAEQIKKEAAHKHEHAEGCDCEEHKHQHEHGCDCGCEDEKAPESK